MYDKEIASHASFSRMRNTCTPNRLLVLMLINNCEVTDSLPTTIVIIFVKDTMAGSVYYQDYHLCER